MFDLHAGLAVSETYDDNLNFSNSKKLSDFYLSITPLIVLTASDNLQEALGKSLTMTYSPWVEKYVRYPDFDSLNQSVNLAGYLPFSHLRLGFSQTYSDTTAPVVDVQRRVAVKSYTTLLTSRYAISDKTSVEINGDYNLSQNEGLISSEEYHNQNWFNYKVTPKIESSVGLGLGMTKTDIGNNQIYQEIRARASYRVSEKINASLSAGLQIREFDLGDTALDPVFTLSARYKPVSATSIVISGSRQTRASIALAGQNYTSTSFNLDLYQKMMEHLTGTVGVGFDTSEYQGSITGVKANRSDQIFAGNAGLTWVFTKGLRATLAYHFRKNSSNNSLLNAQENVVSLSTSYLY